MRAHVRAKTRGEARRREEGERPCGASRDQARAMAATVVRPDPRHREAIESMDSACQQAWPKGTRAFM